MIGKCRFIFLGFRTCRSRCRLDFRRSLVSGPRFSPRASTPECLRWRSAGSFPEQRLVIESRNHNLVAAVSPRKTRSECNVKDCGHWKEKVYLVVQCTQCPLTSTERWPQNLIICNSLCLSNSWTFVKKSHICFMLHNWSFLRTGLRGKLDFRAVTVNT